MNCLNNGESNVHAIKVICETFEGDLGVTHEPESDEEDSSMQQQVINIQP